MSDLARPTPHTPAYDAERGSRRAALQALERAARDQVPAVDAPFTAVRDVSDWFVDETDLLLEVHREWVRALVSRLHAGRIVPERTVEEIRRIYAATAAARPGLRRLLDRHRDRPELQSAIRREHALLASLAGPGAAAPLGELLGSVA